MRRLRLAIAASGLVVAATSAAAPARAAEDGGSGGCEEKIPEGKPRPKLVEKFPERGLSGHALPLEVTVEHGQGEVLLPTGFKFQGDSAEAKALQAAGFILPDPSGGAGPKLTRREEAGKASTRAVISFVALPKTPGRHQLELPALPLTVSRANGEIMRLCTARHTITIEDPTANTPNAKPKPNPPPRPQREEWTALKNAVAIGAAALVAGALAAWVFGRWRRRPRPLPPPPPPRPPWETALESLHDLRHSGLITEQRYAEHFDRVSDILRRYLGDRFGFDGLECTTRELLLELRRASPTPPVLDEIERFLRHADLVKFARLTPSEAECLAALVTAEDVVQRTLPAAPPPVAAAPPPPAAEERVDG